MRSFVAVALVLAAAPAFAKDPALGATTFTVYETFLSPQQEPGEESEAPAALAKATGLQATAPALPREQRKSRGWAQLRFSRDLARAFVDVELKGVNPTDAVMLHVHCGRPGTLGPIVVDLGEQAALPALLARGVLSAELSNKNMIYVAQMPRGLKPASPDSCPLAPGAPLNLAALESLARQGGLYVDLHTKSAMFYGEVRGQVYPAQ